MPRTHRDACRCETEGTTSVAWLEWRSGSTQPRNDTGGLSFMEPLHAGVARILLLVQRRYTLSQESESEQEHRRTIVCLATFGLFRPSVLKILKC